MVTVSAHFDGKVIVPDEPTDLIPGARLRVTIEAVEPGPASKGKLELPLLTGVAPDLVHAVLLDPDFDAAAAEIDRLPGPLSPGGPI